MPNPEKTFRAGSITASIWAACGMESGEIVKRYTVKIQRFYKKDGLWKHTHVHFADDLPNIILVAREAYKYLCPRQDKQPNTNINLNKKEV